MLINSTLLAQVIGLALWMLTIALAWHTLGRHRQVPGALLWPGYLATLPVAFILRGMFGEASAALPALTAYACGRLTLPTGGRYVLGMVIGVSLLLYASALGWFSFDLYGRGYFPTWEMTPVVALLIACYFQIPALAWAWLFGLGLLACGIHPSPNLWDVLIDLPSMLMAAWLILRRSKAQLAG